MQNKFGFHLCKDLSGEPHPKHEQIYLETTVQNIGTGNYSADTEQKVINFDIDTETVVPDPN